MSVEVVLSLLECAPALWWVLALASPHSFTLMKRRSYKPCHVFPYSFICPTHEAVKCAAQEQGGTSVVAEAYKKRSDLNSQSSKQMICPDEESASTQHKK